MILRAKYLITGDGRTCLQDQAVYLDKEGKIGWIGDAAEAAGRYPEEMVKDYGEATILPGLFDMHVHFGYYYSQPYSECRHDAVARIRPAAGYPAKLL